MYPNLMDSINIVRQEIKNKKINYTHGGFEKKMFQSIIVEEKIINEFLSSGFLYLENDIYKIPEVYRAYLGIPKNNALKPLLEF